VVGYFSLLQMASKKPASERPNRNAAPNAGIITSLKRKTSSFFFN
jgi:hypothetical protein